MEISRYLEALERDGAAFVDACLAAPEGARVPSCPEWDVRDLLWHLTEVHDFWCSVVDQRAAGHEQVVEAARPADAELEATYRRGLDRLLAVLRSTDPGIAVWTWSHQQDVAWVIRRMAQETAVHRADAESARGAVAAIEAELASDGIDEFLHHFLVAAAAPETVGGSVHLHCTDVAGEWTVRVADGAFVTAREHAKGDAAMRGAASDLLLALWRRVPLESLDVVGDAAVAQRFVDATRLG